MRDHLFSLIVIGLICAGFVVTSLLSMRLLRRMPDFKYKRDLLRGATWAPVFTIAVFAGCVLSGFLSQEGGVLYGWRLVPVGLVPSGLIWWLSSRHAVAVLGPAAVARIAGETDEELVASAEAMVERMLRYNAKLWVRAVCAICGVFAVVGTLYIAVVLFRTEGNLKRFEREGEIAAQLEAELGGPGRVKSVIILDTSTFQIPRPILRVRAEGEPGDDDLVRLAEKAGEALLATGVRGAVDLDVRAADGRVVRGTCDAESRTVELEPVRLAPASDVPSRSRGLLRGLLRPRGGL